LQFHNRLHSVHISFGGLLVDSTLVEVNGVGAWAYVVELAEGLRLRQTLDDHQWMDLGLGQRIPVRLLGQEARLFVTNVTELPPVAWVTLAKPVRAGPATSEG
jgi:hypothetical protein